MLKIRCPRFVASTLAAGVLLATAPFVQSAEEVIGYVKISAPKKVATELQQAMQTIMPGMQGQMMMTMFLSPYGFPTFPGVSEEEPVTIVFSADLENPMAPPRVIALAKMSADSLTRQALTQQGMQIQDSGEWTLISPDAMMFEGIPDVDQLKATAAISASHDIEARLLLGPEKSAKAAEMIKGLLMMQMTDVTPENMKNTEGLITLLRQELGNLEWFSHAIDVDGGNLILSVNGEAVDGTPLARLFSMQGGADVAIAKYLSADDPLVFIGSYDVEEMLDFMGGLSARGQSLFDGEISNACKAFDDIVTMSEGKYTGDFVASLSFEDIENPAYTAITESKLSQDETATMMMEFYGATNSLIEFITSATGTDAEVGMTLSITPDVDEYKGIRIHKGLQNMQEASPYAGLPDEVLRNIILEEAGGACALDSAIEQKMKEYRSGENVETVSYIANAKGNIIESADLGKLKSVIDRLLSDDAVSNPIAEMLSLKEKEILTAQLDIQGLMLQLLENPEMAMGIPFTPAQIKALNLEPITMNLQTNAGEANGQAMIPMSMIGTIVQESMKAQQQQQMQP